MTEKKRILVVDDEESIRLICEMALQQNGFKTFSASDGSEALKVVENQNVDLILSDIFMPMMNGFQLLQSLKKDPYYNQIPVIFLTAATDNDHIIEGLQLGAEDYISKPIRIKEVIARVQMVLSKIEARHQTKPQPQQGHAVKADLDTRRENKPVGKLEEKPLIDVIAFCEANSLTGELIVTHENRRGKLMYRKGELLEVSLDDKKDDAAIDELMSWQNGTFEINQQLLTLDALTKSLRSDAKSTMSSKEGGMAPAPLGSKAVSIPADAVIAALNAATMHVGQSMGEAKVGNYFRRAQLAHVNKWNTLGYFVVDQRGKTTALKPIQLNGDDIVGVSEWIKSFTRLCAEKDPQWSDMNVVQIVKNNIHDSHWKLLDSAGFPGYF
ncbi:MAG TPA: response regulator [bacterium]|nr:response regulator [bacterium]HMW35659.1 response regulator [bacterium]HMY37319.1 response regulator [bacterium]HMZ04964.1 response regulator [bacterium]HNB08927.1 response regulator [bacterium]